MKSLSVTIQIKATCTELYFTVVLFGNLYTPPLPANVSVCEENAVM